MELREATATAATDLFVEGRRATAGSVTATGLATLGGAGLLLLRQTGTGALDTIYAEDGFVFLHDAVDGSAAAIVDPYAGYLHVLPRLVAAGVAALPPTLAAAGAAVAAALAVSLLAQVLRVAITPHLRSSRLAWMVAAGVILLPVGQEEVFNALANIHWFLAVPVFWVLLWRPPSRAGTVAASAFVALAALSDPFVLALAPVAVVRLALFPTARDRLIPVALLVGAAGQAVAMLGAGSDRALGGSTSLARVGGQFVTHVLGAAVLGDAARTHLPDVVMALTGVAAVALLLSLWALHRDRFTRPDDLLLGVVAAGAVALFAGPVLLAGAAPPRYSVAPVLMVYGAAVLVVDRTRERAPGDLLAAVFVGIVVVAAVNFPLVNTRAGGPSWGRSVESARIACASRPAPAEADLAMVPTGTFPLPCAWLVGMGPTPAPETADGPSTGDEPSAIVRSVGARAVRG